MATPPSGVARAGTAGQAARAFAARGQAISADMLEGDGSAGRSTNGGRRPGDRGIPEKKGLPLLLVVVIVITMLPIALGAYIVLAPDTMWKPLYVRVEMEDATPVVGAAVPTAAVAQVAPTDSHAPTQPQHLQPLQPPTTVPVATVPPLQPPGPGVMYQLGAKVVNLADPGGLRYLQASIVLELHPELNAYLIEQDMATSTAAAGGASAAGHGGYGGADIGAASALDARRPIIDDAVMTTLSSKRYNDISTIKGKQALKEELIVAINRALGVPGVLNIYFTEFVVQ